MDVEAPFNDVEIHILAMLLDPETEGSIQIKKFSQGIYEICKEEEMRVIRLLPSPLIKPLVRWVRIHFQNATVASVPFHPLHFQEDVPSFYTTDLLIDIIRRQNHACTPSVKMFIKRSATPAQEIQQIGATLTQLGIKGGTKLNPEEVTILYESECKFDSSIAKSCTTSIESCYLLWDEAPLWSEEVINKDFATKTKDEVSSPVSGSSEEDSDASSIVSLATYLTMAQRTRRRAKVMRRLARKCEQRIRAAEVSRNEEHSEAHSIISDSLTN
nr:conserved hypothetical protein [Hymenolepis microstoma]